MNQPLLVLGLFLMGVGFGYPVIAPPDGPCVLHSESLAATVTGIALALDGHHDVPLKRLDFPGTLVDGQTNEWGVPLKIGQLNWLTNGTWKDASKVRLHDAQGSREYIMDPPVFAASFENNTMAVSTMYPNGTPRQTIINDFERFLGWLHAGSITDRENWTSALLASRYDGSGDGPVRSWDYYEVDGLHGVWDFDGIEDEIGGWDRGSVWNATTSGRWDISIVAPYWIGVSEGDFPVDVLMVAPDDTAVQWNYYRTVDSDKGSGVDLEALLGGLELPNSLQDPRSRSETMACVAKHELPALSPYAESSDIEGLEVL